MLTGSEDGLMCFFDTGVSSEEDVSQALSFALPYQTKHTFAAVALYIISYTYKYVPCATMGLFGTGKSA